MGYGKITTGLLLTTTLWCGSFQVQAFDATHPTWNLGATVGHVSRQGGATFAYSQAAPVTVGAANRSLSDAGSLYGILFGADWRHNRFLVGLGLSADWQNTGDVQAFHTVAPFGSHHGIHFLYDRGLALGFFGRVGFQVTDYAMPYVKIGAQTSRDKMTFRDTSLGNGGGVAVPLVVGTSDTTINDRVTTMVFGAGLEIPTFVYNTSLRFEYDYVAPDKMTMNTGYANVRTDVSYKPKEHIGKLSWVWNFS